MHDLDRTQLEAEEMEYEDEYENEFESEYEDEFENEFEMMDDGSEGNPLSEAEEMELAAELLEVTSDEEMEQFLGKLARKIGRKVKRIGRGVRRFSRSRLGRTVFRGLRKIAKRALPIAGSALGGTFGGPIGARIGGSLAPALGRAFGLELEGLSPEDQEFEVARRFVKLAATATKKAANAPSTSAPEIIAKKAIMSAVKQHAPGLISNNAPTRTSGQTGSGRWVRRGGKIILIGV